MIDDDDRDSFAPPKQNTEVRCLHCGAVYESYQIEWRPETDPTSPADGHWCCPTPGCTARGFRFDILPTDPNYRDEFGGWYDDGEEPEFSPHYKPPAESPTEPPPLRSADEWTDDIPE